jgi:hypothetical protein
MTYDFNRAIREHEAERLRRRLGRYVLAFFGEHITYEARRAKRERWGYRDERGAWQGYATRHKAAAGLAEELGLTEKHAAKMQSWQG